MFGLSSTHVLIEAAKKTLGNVYESGKKTVEGGVKTAKAAVNEAYEAGKIRVKAGMDKTQEMYEISKD